MIWSIPISSRSLIKLKIAVSWTMAENAAAVGTKITQRHTHTSGHTSNDETYIYRRGFVFLLFPLLFGNRDKCNKLSLLLAVPTHTHTLAPVQNALKISKRRLLYSILLLRFSRPTVHTVWHTSANWKRCMQRFWSKITAGIDELARANAPSTPHTHMHNIFIRCYCVPGPE